MERLSEHTPAGLNAAALRRWGYLFLACGLLGRGLIPTHLLGFQTLTMEQILTFMNESSEVMIFATVALVLQAMETCAAPIFAILLVERARQMKRWSDLLCQLTVLAFVCEIPYNFALYGQFINWESRNPVFAMVLSLILLVYYQRYSKPGFKNTAIKFGLTLAAVVWGRMLQIDHGAPMVLIAAIFWLMRKKPMYRSFAGAAVCVSCMAFSPFYLAAPMGLLAVHQYNGDLDQQSTKNLLVYPLLLVVAAASGWVLSALL